MDASRLLAHAGLVLGVPGGLLGFAVGGTEAAIVGALLAFFVGKSLASLAWTVRGGHAA